MIEDLFDGLLGPREHSFELSPVKARMILGILNHHITAHLKIINRLNIYNIIICWHDIDYIIIKRF